MRERRVRGPDELVCIRCLEPREASELDRILWCDACRAKTRRRAVWTGFLVGAGAALLLALWIRFEVHPSERYRLVWAAIVAAAFLLVSRAAREIAYGVARIKNRPGAGASGPRPLP